MTLRRVAFCWLVLSAACWPGSARCERLFVGILEADGYQSVLYGASAFSRVADLSLALELVSAGMAESFLLPNNSCVAPSELFRVVQTVDPAQPRNDDNPANVAILPLSGNEGAVHTLFATAYSSRRDIPPLTWYERPKVTNLPARVALAFTGKHLLTSRSQEAIQWAWDNRSRLVDAPSQSIPGTVRVLVNPQRLADLLGARSEQAASVFDTDAFLRDFETFSFSLTLDGQAVTLSLRGKPKPGSALETLALSLRSPLSQLWNGFPDDAFLVSVSGCDKEESWNAYLNQSLGNLARPLPQDLPRTSFSGDRLSYLSATRDKQGLCWTRIEPVKSAEPVQEAIKRLQTVKVADGVALVKQPARRRGSVDIETYSLSFRQPEPGKKGSAQAAEPSTLHTLMALFLKQAVVEAAVTEGYLVLTLGPRQSLDDQLESLRFREKALPLPRKIALQDPALVSTLCLGGTLQLASLLRQTVSIMPDVKPEHLRAFPVWGDGMAFGICAAEDHTLTASIKVQSTEIAALQRINRDGREVLQELVFQLFSNQVLHLQGEGKDESAK